MMLVGSVAWMVNVCVLSFCLWFYPFSHSFILIELENIHTFRPKAISGPGLLFGQVEFWHTRVHNNDTVNLQAATYWYPTGTKNLDFLKIKNKPFTQNAKIKNLLAWTFWYLQYLIPEQHWCHPYFQLGLLSNFTL